MPSTLLTASVVSLARFEEGVHNFPASHPDCQVCGSAKNGDAESAWTLQLAIEGTATAEEVTVVSNTSTFAWLVTSRIASSQAKESVCGVTLLQCMFVMELVVSVLWVE